MPRVTIAPRLAAFSAIILSAALWYAPAAYGCTVDWTLPPLFALLAAFLFVALLSLIVARQWPAIPRLAAFCVAAVLLQGWWMTQNPAFAASVATDLGTAHTAEEIRSLSTAYMTATTWLILTFLVLCALLNDAPSRRIILTAIALAGTLISLAGVILKLSGDTFMFAVWGPANANWNDFAFFHYHGNAGAYLNLVWPLILVFARRAYAPGHGLAAKIGWTSAAVLCAIALCLNASKAALIIGLLVLPFPFASYLIRLRKRTLLGLAAVALLLVGGALLGSVQLNDEAAFSRLTESDKVAASYRGRVDAYRQYVAVLPAMGCFGLGPGLFQVAFPYQNSPLGNVGVGLREWAYQDYLQTVLEWGWVGTLWWTLIVGVGVQRALGSYRQRERFTSKTDRHLLLAALLAIAATLAQAMIDFPLQVPSLRLYFLVLLAFCWMSPQMLTPLPPAPPRQMPRYRIPVPAEWMKSATTNSRSP